ncbi:MAG: hypothetical protein LBC98_05160, partial [Prevotellaceae bacterium]|nr:hypothetical protein [Prevotellaceae bacterium]
MYQEIEKTAANVNSCNAMEREPISKKPRQSEKREEQEISEVRGLVAGNLIVGNRMQQRYAFRYS